jgi:hypothetical protein
MSEQEPERATDGPDVLYLQPGNRGDERCWCEDDMPDARDYQPWNKYIREDLIPVSIAAACDKIVALRRELEKLKSPHTTPHTSQSEAASV